MTNIVTINDMHLFLPSVSHVCVKKDVDDIITHYDVYTLNGAKITIQEQDYPFATLTSDLEALT